MKTTKTTKTNGATKVTLPRNDPLVKRLLGVATASGRSPQAIVNSILKEEIPKMENAKPVKLECCMVFEEPVSPGSLNALLTTPHDPEHPRRTKLFLGSVTETSDDPLYQREFSSLGMQRITLKDALEWYVLSNPTATASTGSPEILCAMAAEALAK